MNSSLYLSDSFALNTKGYSSIKIMFGKKCQQYLMSNDYFIVKVIMTPKLAFRTVLDVVQIKF